MQLTTTAVVKQLQTWALTSFHLMDLVVMVPVFARRESQVCRETLDPQDQQALLVHPVHKDPRDHVETKATQGNQEVKASRASRDHEEPKVTQAIKEVRALQARRAFQARWEVTGNNAFGKI